MCVVPGCVGFSKLRDPGNLRGRGLTHNVQIANPECPNHTKSVAHPTVKWSLGPPKTHTAAPHRLHCGLVTPRRLSPEPVVHPRHQLETTPEIGCNGDIASVT